MPRPSDTNLVTNLGTLVGTDAIPIDRVGVNLAKKTTPADILTYVKTTTDQYYQPLSSVLTGTSASFTTTLETKLDGIASGAEVNVNADWNSVSGDSQILNKPSTFPPSSHNHYGDTLEPDVVAFQTDIASAPTAVGATYWDAANRCLATVTGAATTTQHGQELPILCRNDDGAILNGQPVRLVGGTGNYPRVNFASASSEVNSYLLGIATEDIASSGLGLITVFGLVNDIPASNIICSTDLLADWQEGLPLYLSTETGKLTVHKPIAPSHGNFVGSLMNKTGSGNGTKFTVFCHPTIGFELDELHDVLNGAAANDLLLRNDSNTLWEPKSIAEVGLVTGPASSANGNFALFDQTTGKIIKDGGQGMSYFATAANFGLHTSATTTAHGLGSAAFVEVSTLATQFGLTTHEGLTNTAHGGLQPSSAGLTDLISKWTPASTTIGTQLTLAEGTNNGTNTVTIESPASLAANYTLILPIDDGTANQSLQTDGTGTLSWATTVSDIAYDATTWDGVTTIAPSKNAIRDKIETLITYEILYSVSGDVTAKTGTLGRIIKIAGTVTAGSVRFGTAGTTGDTTIAVKNGSNTVGTCTIASGGTTGTLTLSSTTLAAGDVLTVDCTAVATTAPTNLTITMLVTRS